MIEANVVINNPTGLHARPATLFVNFLKKYDCSIYLKYNEKTIDPKSILALLSLGLSKGTEVIIYVEGENEEVIITEIVEYLTNMTE